MRKIILSLSAIASLTACVKLPLDDASLPGQIIVKCDSCKVVLTTNADAIVADLAKVGNSVRFYYGPKTVLKVAIVPKSKQTVMLRIFNRVNIQEFISRDTMVMKGDTAKYRYTFSK